jgi:hypothetical protein
VFFFRKKDKGVILVIIGSFFLFVSIISIYLTYNLVYRGISVPPGMGSFELSPFHYFSIWIQQYGWSIILGILGGLALIFYSNRYFLIKKEFDDSAIT